MSLHPDMTLPNEAFGLATALEELVEKTPEELTAIPGYDDVKEHQFLAYDIIDKCFAPTGSDSRENLKQELAAGCGENYYARYTIIKNIARVTNTPAAELSRS